jgi:hypothetical protein
LHREGRQGREGRAEGNPDQEIMQEFSVPGGIEGAERWSVSIACNSLCSADFTFASFASFAVQLLNLGKKNHATA